MNKLAAVKTTKQDNMIIKAAVDAIRSVSLRFHEANKKTNGAHPHILLQVNDTDALFTVQLIGCTQSPASGRTLDEAFESLCANQDAEFLRRRAKTLMDKAQELMDEAAQMDGATPNPEHDITEAGVGEMIVRSVSGKGFFGSAAALAAFMNKDYPDHSLSAATIALAIKKNNERLTMDHGMEIKNTNGVIYYRFPAAVTDPAGAEGTAGTETTPSVKATTEGGAK